VINNTEIPFSNREIRLFQKGLKYNIHTKKKKLDPNPSTRSRNSHHTIPTNERDAYRKLVAECIEKLQKQNPSHNTHPEAKIINQYKKN